MPTGRTRLGSRTAALWALLAGVAPLSATQADTARAVDFGGPNAVENQVSEDAQTVPAFVKERALQPWFDWKDEVKADTGISFGLDYTGLYLGSNSGGNYGTGKDSASSGIVRFFGAWELFGRGSPNNGALVWKVENRHAYGKVAPGAFGLAELGYVGLIDGPWNDDGNRLTNLYWRQRLLDGRATVTAGYLDATDYVDAFGAGSPWTGFGNLAFSTGSASMFLPNDATLGIAAAAMLTDNLYAIGGITNAYAEPTDPFSDSFDRFFGDGEHFASLELGWTESQQHLFFDNTHLSLWHVDDSVEAGATKGWGVAFQHIRHLNKQWMPFLRGGYAEDGGSLLQKSVSAGVLYQRVPGADLAGLGLNWGQPNETTFQKGLDDQYTLEAFYRFQLTQQLAITPSIEYLKNPALNPEDRSSLLFGIRARLAL